MHTNLQIVQIFQRFCPRVIHEAMPLHSTQDYKTPTPNALTEMTPPTPTASQVQQVFNIVTSLSLPPSPSHTQNWVLHLPLACFILKLC